MRAALLATIALVFISGCERPKGDTPQKLVTHAELIATAKKRGERDCSKDYTYMMAASSLGGASEQMKLGDYRRANMLFRNVENDLRNLHLGSDVIDDTSLFLTAAWSQEWDGNQKGAAVNRYALLSDQLKSYVEIQNLSRCPSPEDVAKMGQLPLDLHEPGE